MMMLWDLRRLRESDAASKPTGADDEWAKQHRLYDDCSRDDTLQRLRQLGLGLAGNTRPLEVSLLRRIVDRLAVTYSRAPTRWLQRNGRRLAESNRDHRAMLDVLRLAQYDLAWRLADRQRALMRQVVLRFYPSDARRSVVLRCFPPYAVLRDPSPACPDSMDEDRAFALLLERRTDRETWEMWRKTQDGWLASWVNQEGTVVAGHPFEGLGPVPYAQLPVQIIYDDYPGGRAWLPPRHSRSTWAEALNAQANDLWNLIVNEAHTETYVSTNDSTQVPDEHGPGVRTILPRDSEMGVLNYSPKIKESQDAINNFVRLLMYGEDLPVSEFDDAKQVVTGAALKVQSRPLLDRRENQAALAGEDERQAWRRFVSVHNVHADAWGVEALATDTDIDVELAPLEIPEDESRLLDTDAKAIAMGARSSIDAIQRLHVCSREQAITIYERVRADRERYPIEPPDEMVDEPQPIDGRSSAQDSPDLPVDPVAEVEDSPLTDPVDSSQASDRE